MGTFFKYISLLAKKKKGEKNRKEISSSPTNSTLFCIRILDTKQELYVFVN